MRIKILTVVVATAAILGASSAMASYEYKLEFVANAKVPGTNDYAKVIIEGKDLLGDTSQIGICNGRETCYFDVPSSIRELAMIPYDFVQKYHAVINVPAETTSISWQAVGGKLSVRCLPYLCTDGGYQDWSLRPQ